MLPFGPLFARDLPVIEVERLRGTFAVEDAEAKRTWDHTRRRFLRWEPERVTPLLENLSPRGGVPTPGDLPLGGLLAASEDCRAVAALTLDRFTAACDGRQTFEVLCHQAWHGRDVIGAVAFPWGDHRVVAIVSTEDPTAYRLLIVDAAAGELHHELVLHSDHPAGFTLNGHPTGGGFVVDAGRGQDGTDLWSVQVSDGTVTVTSAATFERVFADFSPDGTEVLTTPHNGTDLEIFAWPDWTPLVALSGEAVFATDGNQPVDSFDYFAAYLTSRSILAKSTEYGGMVVVDRLTGNPTHRLLLPGLEADEDGATPIKSFALIGRTHLLTWSWSPGGSSMDIWSLPEDLWSP